MTLRFCRNNLEFLASCAIVFFLANVPLMAQTNFGHRDSTEKVRVAILKNAEPFEISIRGPYRMIDPGTGRVLNEGRRLRYCRVSASAGGLAVGGQAYGLKKIGFELDKDIAVRRGRDEKRYRERLDIIREANGTLTAVNTINIEDYIRGVLYHEVSHRWAMEALKAQAVVARTYAAYQIAKNRSQNYDVTSNIYSQVYGGKSAERYRTNLAVGRTQGEILTYHGEILPAYFHSTCGGRTEDASELWKHQPITPLMGVKCDFCRTSPHYRWKKNFRLKDIQDKLNAKGHPLGPILEIRILERDRSGRNRKMQISDRWGKKVTLLGKDFREILGPNNLKSNLYEVAMLGYYCDFVGRGWGHGVGMCQWGANEMSRQRYDYQEILKYYYPGAQLTSSSQIAGKR